jgi:uncharacterized protein (DUF1810 family)
VQLTEPGQNNSPALDDPYDLERFVSAQNTGGTYERAIGELRGGQKTSHWMWFVFPQIAGLGLSPTSKRFALSSLEEARAYLLHAVLGPRLTESARTITEVQSHDAEQIFGTIDARKLQSCMTLFMRAAPDTPIFRQVLDQYFDGSADAATDQLLQADP